MLNSHPMHVLYIAFALTLSMCKVRIIRCCALGEVSVEGGGEGGLGQGEVEHLPSQGGVVPRQLALRLVQLRHRKPASAGKPCIHVHVA